MSKTGRTRPDSEQIRFSSYRTGDQNPPHNEWILDHYIEMAEHGNRTIADLLLDLFDGDTGDFRPDNFEFRFDPVTSEIQYRIGHFATGEEAWITITPFFEITDEFVPFRPYRQFDLIKASTKDVYIVHGITTHDITFSTEEQMVKSPHTTKIVDTEDARKWAIKQTGKIDEVDYSSKAWAIGGVGVSTSDNPDDPSDGSSKEWAIKLDGPVGTTGEYSAK